MIKIAIISPFMANGGAERVAITEAEALSHYFDVTLIVMDSFKIDYPYSGKMIDMKLSLMDRNIPKRIFNMAASVWKLRKLKKMHRFDVVISHGELANLPNILSGGQKNIIVVHQNRFAALKDMQGKAVNWLIKYLYTLSHVSKIVTVSEGIKERFAEVIGIKNHIQTIYNPYDIAYIQREASASVEEMAPLFASPVVATAGRLTMAKGQWYLLRIFKALKAKNPQAKLMILGEGEMREKLVSLSHRLGFKTYTVWGNAPFGAEYDVYFMGFQKNPFRFIHASKLFVMSSLWEGFGGTIVEAMASGTPVLSTHCPSGPGEIIAPYFDTARGKLPYLDENGILMPTFERQWIDETTPLSENEQVWVGVVDDFLKNDEALLPYAQKGRQRAEDFSLDAIMAQWKALIEQIVQE